MSTLQTRTAPTAIRLPETQRVSLASWAEEGYPHEVCGILLGQGESDGGRIEVVEVRRAENVEEARPADRYRLDPGALASADATARAAGLDIIGFWHSHPDSPAVPSRTDLEHAWPGYAYVIVSVLGGDVAAIRSWELIDDQFHEGEIDL